MFRILSIKIVSHISNILDKLSQVRTNINPKVGLYQIFAYFLLSRNLLGLFLALVGVPSRELAASCVLFLLLSSFDIGVCAV